MVLISGADNVDSRQLFLFMSDIERRGTRSHPSKKDGKNAGRRLNGPVAKWEHPYRLCSESNPDVDAKNDPCNDSS